MNSLLDLAFTLLTSPRKAMASVTKEERFRDALLLWIFVVILCTLSAFGEGSSLVAESLAMAFILGIGILVHSAATDYISGLWGGNGSAKGITAGFLAASLPMAFGVFFTFLDTLGLDVLTGVGSFAIWAWTFYLDMTAIRENYGFSAGKSFVINGAPYLLMGLMVLLSMAILVILAAAGISAMENVQDIESIIDAL